LNSAIYTSGFDSCLAVSVDGFGDAVAGRVSLFRDGAVKNLNAIPIYHSIGTYYIFAAAICGFPKIYHCGKVTGLAAYSPREGAALDYFRKRIVFDKKTGKIINTGYFLIQQFQEMKRELSGLPIEEIAGAVQRRTEEVLTAYIDYWIRRSGEGKIALAGGVFANVKLNQRLSQLPSVEKIFIHPNMGDGGLPAGAAFEALRELCGGKLKPYGLDHVFLGPTIVTEGLEERTLARQLKCTRRSNINETIAQHLADSKVVARVTGAMEYGPRALGNRSLLYQATDPTVNDWLNKKLNRTEFMPFAPMLLEEDAHLLLKDYSDKNSHTAQFMTITYDVTDLCQRTLPAIIHVDGTARPQIIRKETNRDCYEILKHYKAKTGLLAIINTSYNLHDEPIVQSSDDAIRAFKLGRLDVLILDDFEITLSDAARTSGSLHHEAAGSEAVCNRWL